MKLNSLEFFEELLLAAAYCIADLVLFFLFLDFFGTEKAHLFAGFGLGFIFYNLAIKIGMIKYD